MSDSTVTPAQGSKDATVPVAEEDATKSTTTEQPSKGKEVATTDKEDDEEQEEEIVDAQELLAQGVRSLALKKWDHACDQLSRAVEALTDKYGELAPEAGDAMILYGKALLNNAIAQGAVLGGAPGKAEETEEAVQNAVAGPSSGGAPVTAQSIQFHFGGDAEDDEEEEEEEEEGPGAGDKEDDLETAFLMLDMAKTIFSKIDKEEAKLKLGEAYRLLGDVATEGERFGEAVAEYTSALNVLASVHPPYHRSLSELHMLIALALDFVPNAVDRAVSHAEKAKSVLLLKLEQLEGLKEGERTEKDEREIKDIKELVGDVDMKIEDLKVVPEEAPKTAAELALEELIRSSTGPAATAGIVNNLNSLVKKKKAPTPAAAPASGSGSGSNGVEANGSAKRKAEEADANGAGEGTEKKVKLDQSSNA